MRITGTVEVVEKAKQKVEQILSAEQQKLELIKRGWTTNNNNFGLGSCLDTATFDVTEVRRCGRDWCRVVNGEQVISTRAARWGW